jgi:hypothetical protein
MKRFILLAVLILFCAAHAVSPGGENDVTKTPRGFFSFLKEFFRKNHSVYKKELHEIERAYRTGEVSRSEYLLLKKDIKKRHRQDELTR